MGSESDYTGKVKRVDRTGCIRQQRPDKIRRRFQDQKDDQDRVSKKQARGTEG